jgi:hypothetical protein
MSRLQQSMERGCPVSKNILPIIGPGIGAAEYFLLNLWRVFASDGGLPW